MRPEPNVVKVEGRLLPVLERIGFTSRSLLVVERLSSSLHRRFRVWDPLARDQRVLICLPARKDSFQHLAVLRRLANSNPSFPQIHEYHRFGEEIRVLLNWIPGINLAAYLRARDTTQNSFDAFNIFRRLAHAVCQLHKHSQCIHGDLKPTNVILGRRSNQVVLVDFGSAWTRERTAFRQVGDGMTEGYAAPEQYAEAGLVDVRADQFAVSVIGYQLFTGDLPYEGLGGKAGLPQFIEEFRSKLGRPSEKTQDPSRMSREVWRAIDSVLMKGVALDAEERYPGRDEWLGAIDEIYALLRLRPKLGFLDRLVLRPIVWIGSWFSSTEPHA